MNSRGSVAARAESSGLAAVPSFALARAVVRWMALAWAGARPWMPIACITLLAAGTRFFKLGQWSFWHDEVHTIDDAGRVLQHLVSVPPPPLSLLLTRMVLGWLPTNEWSARLVSAVVGTLSVPLLYVAVRKLSSQFVAVMFALLLAVAPWHIHWSQNARFYTTLMLLYTLGAFAFFYGLERNRFRYLALSLVLLFFAVGERVSALFLVLVVAVYLLLLALSPLPKPPGLCRRNLLPLAGVVGLGGAFEVYRAATKGGWLLADFVATFVGHPIGDPARLLYDVLYNLGFPVLGFAFFSGAYLVRHRSRLGLFLLVSGVVPIVALEAVSPFVFAEDRYAMVTLPAWIFLAALGMRELWRQVAAGPAHLLVGGIGSALVLTSLVVLVPYYTVDEGQQADWRGAFALVDSRRAPADVVVTTQPEVASYYLPVPVERFDDLSPAGIVATRARHWFILDARTRWATPGLKAWLEENGTLLAILPRRVPQDQTLFVYRYDPLEHATGSDETL